MAQMSLYRYCRPADGVLGPLAHTITPNALSEVNKDCPANIIIDIIASHTRVDRKPLHSSANGIGTAACSIVKSMHMAEGGMHAHHMRHRVPRMHAYAWVIQVMKIKPQKLVLTATFNFSQILAPPKIIRHMVFWC